MTIVFSQASPRPDLDWKILVDGSVQNRLQLNLTELMEMPRTTVQAELACYGLPLAKGDWTGVKLSVVLEKAGVIEENAAITFRATDDYQVSLPLSEAKRDDVILAYELNMDPLPETIRLVVPGGNGNVWIRWITLIMIGSDSFQSSSGQSQTVTQREVSRSVPAQNPLNMQDYPYALNMSVPEQPTNQSGTEQREQSSDQPAEQRKPVQQKVAESPKPFGYGYVIVSLAVAASVVSGAMFVKYWKGKHR